MKNEQKVELIREGECMNRDNHERLRRIASDKRENEAARIAAVNRLGPEDQDLLQIIAADRPDNPDLYDYRELRAAAVSKLTDEKLLRRYLGAWEWQVRLAAMTALKDQDVLKETVLDGGCGRVMRETALRYIHDQEFLYEIALDDIRYIDGPVLAETAAGMVSDPEKLVEIALCAGTFEASKAAAERISDDEHLLRILREVKTDRAEKKRDGRWLDPVGRYMSHDVLAEDIMCVAAEKLSDLRPLVRIVLDDPGDGLFTQDRNFKECGIDLLSEEPDLLLDYVRKETDSVALEYALGRSLDPRVRQAAAENPHAPKWLSR